MHRIRFGLNLLLAFAMLAIASKAVAARDLSIESLVGRWCGSAVDYTFSRTEPRVVLHDKQRTLTHGPVLEIQNVKTGDGWIEIKWKGAGNTVFWKFSDDGRQMFQKANDAGDHGPERKFHRC